MGDGRPMAVRILIILLLIVWPGAFAIAGQVTVTWDHNDPLPDGYRIFVRLPGAAYDYDSPAWEDAGNSATLAGPALGVTHYYVVRAYEGELESVDSDEVHYTNLTKPLITQTKGEVK